MITEGARLTDPGNKIIHKAGSYSLDRDQSCSYHTLDLEDFS